MVFGGDWVGQNAKLVISYEYATGITKTLNFTITKRTVQDLLQKDVQKGIYYIELNAGTNHRLKKGSIPFPLYTQK